MTEGKVDPLDQGALREQFKEQNHIRFVDCCHNCKHSDTAVYGRLYCKKMVEAGITYSNVQAFNVCDMFER